jgi:hypothetical protein
MTLTLELPPEIEAGLNAQARAKGLSLDVYVTTLLQNQALGGPQEVEEERLRKQRQAAADRIRKLREGVTLGPDLSIRDLINEGRRF